jgi:fatty acid synthase
LPDGLEFGRWGIPSEMTANLDRMGLLNLVTVAEALAAAGVQPEELLERMHPTEIANAIGSGLGGMASIRKLYLGALFGDETQPDQMQETLINVNAAYPTQALFGGYGSMIHPVGACATAAVSLEVAFDKLRSGTAKFVLAGGFDDLGPEGVVGFGDMNATARTEALAAVGIAPAEMSRANDVRRAGFVESMGGGTMLCTTAAVAVELGLPIAAVVAYAGSFGDGIQASVPAPGLGAVAAASGGAASPLARGLARLGLEADDIAVVSKHDTATLANDPNEADLHERIADALGRTPGNPLFVVSQKSITGHSKGGAAAWQIGGLCQILASGVIPGNPHLEEPDPLLAGNQHLVYLDAPLALPRPPRAALMTSLGFGHVSALICLAHPETVTSALRRREAARYAQVAAWRRARGEQRRLAQMIGRAGETDGRRPLFAKRTERRFASADGTEAQREEEAAMLLNPDSRLGSDGRYRVLPGERPR